LLTNDPYPEKKQSAKILIFYSQQRTGPIACNPAYKYEMATM